jgi:hypothetical protein
MLVVPPSARPRLLIGAASGIGVVARAAGIALTVNVSPAAGVPVICTCQPLSVMLPPLV